MAITLTCTALAGPYEDAERAYAYGDYATAVRLLHPLADQGNATAQNQLGNQYARGKGVPQDYVEASKWYRKSAEQGYAVAQSNLGTSYYQGQGVTQDYREAFKWSKRAADQGDARAQVNLGWLYDRGQGVPQDHNEAFKWYEKAAELGLADGQNNLENFIRDLALKNRDTAAGKMTPAQIAEAQRLALEWKPR